MTAPDELDRVVATLRSRAFNVGQQHAAMLAAFDDERGARHRLFRALADAMSPAMRAIAERCAPVRYQGCVVPSVPLIEVDDHKGPLYFAELSTGVELARATRSDPDDCVALGLEGADLDAAVRRLHFDQVALRLAIRLREASEGALSTRRAQARRMADRLAAIETLLRA